MPIIIDSYSQRDPEWFEARLGSPGGSGISKIITTQGKKSKQADDYIMQLAGEIISGRREETYQSIHMLNGIDRENEARELFEFIHDVEVKQVALVYKDEQKKFHVSPDGLIGNDSGIEIKAPIAKTQIKYLLNNKLPVEYFSQIQMSLYVCERKEWWFMSYYPGLPTFELKVRRNEKFISALAKELDKFIDNLISTIRKIKGG